MTEANKVGQPFVLASTAELGPCDAGLRAEAAANGNNKYWTDSSCPDGHKGWRYVLNGYCCECQRLFNLKTRSKLRDAMGIEKKRRYGKQQSQGPNVEAKRATPGKD